MKNIGCLLITFLCSLSGLAQTYESVKADKANYFLGIRINTTGYNLFYKKQPYTGYFAAIPIIHLGYYVTKRTSLQIGTAYGRRKFDGGAVYTNTDGKLQEDYDYSKTKALILPLTLRYTLNPAKRFQFFGSVSVVPAYGSINRKKTEKVDNITTTIYNASTAGFNAFITSSLGLNYRISKRWEGYGEIEFFNRNIENATGFDTFKFLGFGLNYKLLSSRSHSEKKL